MPVEIEVRPCSNVKLLARMYRELAEDERSDTPLKDDQYRQCMEGFLKRGDCAYVFSLGNMVVGYALVAVDRHPYYLRHFFIVRSKRRKGYGTQAFHKLMKILNADTIDLDVYVWNVRGLAFWASLGFCQRAHLMRLKPPTL